MTKRKKSELVDVLIEFAEADRGMLRQLEARFDVAATSEVLVSQTRQARRDATAFDKRDINRNFAYDYGAYAEVKRNLGRLITSGQLPVAMELMKLGSFQVEMSDEGLITEDIEGCLSGRDRITALERPGRECGDRLVHGDACQRPHWLRRRKAPGCAAPAGADVRTAVSPRPDSPPCLPAGYAPAQPSSFQAVSTLDRPDFPVRQEARLARAGASWFCLPTGRTRRTRST